MKQIRPQFELSTTAVSQGRRFAGSGPRPIVDAIYTSVNFDLDDDDYRDIQETGGERSWYYSRNRNPTVDSVEEKIAALEGAESAVLFSSGMAAITTTLLSLVPPGGILVAAEELYGETSAFLRQQFSDFGRTVRFVAVDDLAGWKRALADSPSLLFVESLSNPMLRLANLTALASLAHDVGAKAVVDATFTPPPMLKPLEHGFDVVLHSATKYLNGHSDVTAGVASGDKETIDVVRQSSVVFGSTLLPQGAALLDRGLKTLVIRTERACLNAEIVTDYLESKSEVEAVTHPTISSYPDKDLADELGLNGAAIVTFRVRGGDDRAAQLVAGLSVIHEASSLGSVESLACLPSRTSHSAVSEGQRQQLGILPGTIRLSVGIEDSSDLLEDLEAALEITS
jgi:cystathionine beta-lyase/cystathionine gamma-synthase